MRRSSGVSLFSVPFGMVETLRLEPRPVGEMDVYAGADVFWV